MKYRILGRTNLKISEIGFGAWALGGGWGPQDERDSVAALHTAIDLGVNFIDTAAGYGDGKSERIIAGVLKSRKEKVYVATKSPPADGPWPPSPYCKADDRYSEKYLRKNIEERLRNLNTDCINILQLHTWTRAWNRNPAPLDVLMKLKEEGKIGAIGISTPEQDQNSLVDLMRKGYLDVIQLIYNIFEQEPAAELLPTAAEYDVGVIARVAFDEGVLTGKYKSTDRFPADDFRSRYFAGDRLARAVARVEAIKDEIRDYNLDMPQFALKFVLAHPAVSTVIPGMRNARNAETNVAASELDDLPDELLGRMQRHMWLRGVWYSGK
jgi:aryl-alcohol dehydrogenase-like predicted oxidoreductase